MACAIYIPPALLGLLVPMLLHPGLGPFQLLGSAQAPPPDRRCGPPASPLPQPTLERPSAQHPSPDTAPLPLFTDMSCVENLHGPHRLPCTGSPRSSSRVSLNRSLFTSDQSASHAWGQRTCPRDRPHHEQQDLQSARPYET